MQPFLLSGLIPQHKPPQFGIGRTTEAIRQIIDFRYSASKRCERGNIFARVREIEKNGKWISLSFSLSLSLSLSHSGKGNKSCELPHPSKTEKISCSRDFSIFLAQAFSIFSPPGGERERGKKVIGMVRKGHRPENKLIM